MYWFQVLHTATAAFGYFCYKWEENTLQIGHSKSGRLDYLRVYVREQETSLTRAMICQFDLTHPSEASEKNTEHRMTFPGTFL